MLLKSGYAFVEISFFQALCSLHNGRIRGPSNLIFDHRVGLVLQTGFLNQQGSKYSEQKTAHVRPVGDGRNLPEQSPVEDFH